MRYLGTPVCTIIDEFLEKFEKGGEGVISDPKNFVADLFGNFDGEKTMNFWKKPKGRMASPKVMNFWKSSKRPLIPPPLIFGKSCCAFFPEYMT